MNACGVARGVYAIYCLATAFLLPNHSQAANVVILWVFFYLIKPNISSGTSVTSIEGLIELVEDTMIGL